MNLNELPKDTLRAEVEFVKKILEMNSYNAAGAWINNSPVCRREMFCTGCPIKNMCNDLGCSDTVHAAAREYISQLEAAIKEKEGAKE